MGNLEAKINDQLNKYPFIKKIIKRMYQVGMYSISKKIKSEGNILKLSPDDDFEYFFGYYDKSPWDIEEKRVLCLRAKNTYSSVAPDEPADILLIDVNDRNTYKVIAQTRAWNVQQGCMMQWLGPDFSEKIIYNDFRDGAYCAVILDINTNSETVYPMPVYSVAENGDFALSLDFSRLHRLRKGYGYANLPDKTAGQFCPDDTCIWKIDLKTGAISSLLSYTDFAAFMPRPEMEGAEHKVNHIMQNPSGTRFMVLHRWFKGSQKYTRLVTVNCDGTDMYNLSDDDMVSHCFWKNDNEILAFERKRDSGNGYYLMTDKTQIYKKYWDELSTDGHPSYSPDRSRVVTDTYPDKARVASVKVMTGDDIRTVCKVFAPFRYDNDVRCDLHPRWNRSGDKICFDSVYEGKRGLYYIEV